MTGFGPFREVVDNPSARLAHAVDGARFGEVEVVGRVLPVSYERGPSQTIAMAREMGVDAVVGLGVAVKRSAVEVECQARRCAEGLDEDGAPAPRLDGPAVIVSSWSPMQWAGALGCEVSDDAGSFVCNAWLYRVAGDLDCPVVFIHVPSGGLEPKRFLKALETMAAVGVHSGEPG